VGLVGLDDDALVHPTRALQGCAAAGIRDQTPQSAYLHRVQPGLNGKPFGIAIRQRHNVVLDTRKTSRGGLILDVTGIRDFDLHGPISVLLVFECFVSNKRLVGTTDHTDGHGFPKADGRLWFQMSVRDSPCGSFKTLVVGFARIQA
jgi:hypothetical protein